MRHADPDRRKRAASARNETGRTGMNAWDDFFGPNAGYLIELYERYQRDPGSVDTARLRFVTVARISLPCSRPSAS